MKEHPDWNRRYLEGDTPWDQGGPSPALVTRRRREPIFPPGSRILVPGAGRGHDALFLASEGFEVVAVDLAEEAVRAGRRAAALAGLSSLCEFRQADLFELPREEREAFDGVFEHTCYCAIDPGLRGDYVTAVRDCLRPGGLFLGLMFPMEEREGGPPYGLDETEIRERFEGAGFLLLRSAEAEGSPPARAGRERWMEFERAGGEAGGTSRG